MTGYLMLGTHLLNCFYPNNKSNSTSLHQSMKCKHRFNLFQPDLEHVNDWTEVVNSNRLTVWLLHLDWLNLHIPRFLETAPCTIIGLHSVCYLHSFLPKYWTKFELRCVEFDQDCWTCNQHYNCFRTFIQIFNNIMSNNVPSITYTWYT